MVLVVDIELGFEVVQLGVVEDRPPVPADFFVSRLRDGPVSIVLRLRSACGRGWQGALLCTQGAAGWQAGDISDPPYSRSASRTAASRAGFRRFVAVVFIAAFSNGSFRVGREGVVMFPHDPQPEAIHI